MSATFFIQRLQTFLYFLHVFYAFYFHIDVYYIYGLNNCLECISSFDTDHLSKVQDLLGKLLLHEKLKTHSLRCSEPSTSET